MRPQRLEPSSNSSGSNNNTDSTRALVVSIISHTAALLVIGIPTIVLHSGVKPFARLFFCDDETIAYPFVPHETVSFLAALIGGASFSLATVLIVEYLRLAAGREDPPSVFASCLRYRCGLPDRATGFLSGTLSALYFLAFGAIATELITQSSKLGFARPRPYFLAACRLNVTACQPGRPYSIDWCLSASTLAGRKALTEARLSFPSGHTSYCAFLATFLALYLQARLAFRHEVHALKNVAQLGLLLMASFVGGSRVSDYRHHWSDVLAGGAIGATVGALVACKMVTGVAVFRRAGAGFGACCDYELLAKSERTGGDTGSGTGASSGSDVHQRSVSYSDEIEQP